MLMLNCLQIRLKDNARGQAAASLFGPIFLHVEMMVPEFLIHSNFLNLRIFLEKLR